MTVAVMEVRKMRMLMPHRLVMVLVRMRLSNGAFMSVLMMQIVDMIVLVVERIMVVGMYVRFRQVHPQAEGHQRCGKSKLWRYRRVKQADRKHCANERRE
jgi:hypothetical protein